jgi:hypothetical protein
MALLTLILQLLSPIFSVGLFVAQPLTQTNPVRARAILDKWVSVQGGGVMPLHWAGLMRTCCTATYSNLQTWHITLKMPLRGACVKAEMVLPLQPSSCLHRAGHSAASGLLGQASLLVGAPCGEVNPHHSLHSQLERQAAHHCAVGCPGWRHGQHNQLPNASTTAVGYRSVRATAAAAARQCLLAEAAPHTWDQWIGQREQCSSGSSCSQCLTSVQGCSSFCACYCGACRLCLTVK